MEGKGPVGAIHWHLLLKDNPNNNAFLFIENG